MRQANSKLTVVIFISSLFLALSATGHLIHLCPFSLLMCDVPLSYKSVSDFQLVGSDESEAFVIAITTPDEHDHGQSNLIMMSFSGKQIKILHFSSKQ